MRTLAAEEGVAAGDARRLVINRRRVGDAGRERRAAVVLVLPGRAHSGIRWRRYCAAVGEWRRSRRQLIRRLDVSDTVYGRMGASAAAARRAA